MDITHLRYFLVTAETLNYTRAADRLFLSRQALRQALSSMEKELGMALFVNDRNKLSLTTQGEYLRLSAQRVVDEFDEMLEDMKRLAGEETVLTLAASVSLLPFMLPELGGILKKFQEKYPRIRLETVAMSNDEVMAAVQAGKASCGAVIQMPKERPGMQMRVLAEYRTIISFKGEKQGEIRRHITLDELVGWRSLCIGMGSLEEIAYPLCEDCRKKELSLPYEVVPNAIDAFYRISHGEAVGLDAAKMDVPGLVGVNACYLEGYHWEVGLLHSQYGPHRREIDVFCSFVEEEYQKLRER